MKSFAVVLSCALLTAATASAQLGEVARKEAERRKTVKSSGKTYTNDNLRPDPTPSVPASSSPGTDGAAAPAAPAPADPAAPAAAPSQPAGVSSDPAERKKDEAAWREKIKSERDALVRAETFAEALQSRINGLNTDFVNRDDPAQRSVVAAQREKALAELERVKKEIAQHNKAITDIQNEARKAGVPAGWVR
jgi:gas vesicle protein